MQKSILFLLFLCAIAFSARAQKVVTKAVDNKGTIKWVLDSASAVITLADSTLLYVTPKQLRDSMGNNMKYSDTASMLANYINAAVNGLTKNGQTVKLGGDLIEPTTIVTTPANFLAITGLTAGSPTTDSVLVTDPSTGQIKVISAASLFNALTFSNGLTKTGNNVKLGGILSEATTIATDATNVLKITGLQTGDIATDSLVVTSSDGTLKKVAPTVLQLQSGSEEFSASLGVGTFTVSNLPNNASRVWVYRNGVKLVVTTDYTVSGSNVVLSPAMTNLLADGDVIEVQWVR
jgi:hypothetical protein